MASKKFPPGSRVQSLWGPATVVDHTLPIYGPGRALPKPKTPFWYDLPAGDFYVYPDNGAPEGYSWAPYALTHDGQCQPLASDTTTQHLDISVGDICPCCGIQGEWVALAVKCPKCWKILG